MEVPSSQTTLVCVSSEHETSQYNTHTHKVKTVNKSSFRNTSMGAPLGHPSYGCIGGERTFGLEVVLFLLGLGVTQDGDSGWKTL